MPSRQPPRPQKSPDLASTSTKAARAQLSRQRIFDAALLVADREGADAVSMRRVAKELGVEAMSLYHHVRDREDLLDGLAETMVRSGLPIPASDDPVVILTGFANGIRATALAHPEAFHLVGLRPLRHPDATAAIAKLLHALRAAGMTPDQAVVSYRATAAYARGFALSEIAGLTYGAGGPPDASTGLRAYAKALQRPTATVFSAGLRALLIGLTA